MHNWPEGVRFPPVADHRSFRALKTGKEKTEKVIKSIHNLSRTDLQFIYDAIHDPTHPLRFEIYTGDAEGKY